jgi:hypothetical protein
MPAVPHVYPVRWLNSSDGPAIAEALEAIGWAGGATGPPGPEGKPGATGATGATGPPGPSPERGTALPATPSDGLEYDYIADATNGVIWRFRYRAASASAHKWELVGGGALYAENATVSAFTLTSSTYVQQEVPNTPVLTVPLAGDYLAFFDVEYATQKSVGEGQALSVGIATSTASFAVAAAIATQKQGSNVPMAAQRRLLNVAAGATYRFYASGNNLNEWGLGTKVAAMLPVRVG